MKAIEKNIHLDSISARCSGLLQRIAIKRSDNERVHASHVNKEDGPFYCPDCFSDAIVRKCTEKMDHFAHKSRQSPMIQSKDYELHNKCRDEICAELVKIFPEGKWAKERPILANPIKGTKERIPDISGRINDNPIAIEVQASSYTIERIYQKTKDYYVLGISVLWIIPLKTELGVEPFRPRLFEKYLHSIYYGRIYYYISGEGLKLIPVHFSPAKRWIEETSWFEAGGIERSEGGYYLTYRTVRSPNYGPPVDISRDFEKIEHKGFIPQNVKKEIPKCYIFQTTVANWWDKSEYKNINKQIEVIKKPKSIRGYFENNYDDYDDFEY